MSLTPYLSPLPAGAQVHVYRIEALLEHGRFDLRYQAWDEDLQDRVELREYAPGDWCRRGDDGLSLVPRPEVATEVAVAGTAHGRERFLDEARRLARVRHPALPRQLRCFQANGSVYSVSDLPRGEPLSALLERGAVLEEALLRALLKDVLAVLEQLHAQGCVHQAILPEHLWWDGAEGRWQLVGCGAFRAAMSRYVGQVSEQLGCGYSPPEQYALVEARIGPWSDLYALGAVLYHAIAGAAPVEAPQRLLGMRLTPLQQRTSGGYPAALLEAVEWMLALQPEARPQSVAELRPRLSAAPAATVATPVLAEPPAVASEVPAAASAVPRRRESPKAQGGRAPSFGRQLAGMLSLLGLGGALAVMGGAWWLFSEPSRPPEGIPRYVLQKDGTPGSVVPNPALSDPAAPMPAAPASAAAPQPATVDPAASAASVAAEPALEPIQLQGIAMGSAAQEPGAPNADPTATGDADVAQLLVQAREALEALRLTTPEDNSAYYYYRQVLQLEPDNAEAQQGLDEIATRYAWLMERELQRGNYSKARYFLKLGLGVQPKHGQLLLLSQELARVEQAAAMAPAPGYRSGLEVFGGGSVPRGPAGQSWPEQRNR